MKSMKCSQLGGPETCDKEFHANTFEEIAELSKSHSMEMFQKGDKAHIKAMKKMKELMQKQNKMREWMDKRRQEFDALPKLN